MWSERSGGHFVKSNDVIENKQTNNKKEYSKRLIKIQLTLVERMKDGTYGKRDQ